MSKVAIGTILTAIALTSCSAQGIQKQPAGVWRNDQEKLDYHFGPEDLLEVIGDNGSMHDLGCTYSVEKRDADMRTVTVWFNCPQSDWPGYAELHEFIFDDKYESFVDTMYIQGIPSRRYEGRFVQL